MNSHMTLGLILSLLFIGSVALDYTLYVYNGYKPLNQGNIPSYFPLSAYAADSANNLNLTMRLNASFIAQGQSIELTIDESNILNMTNAVNASTNWPLSSLRLGPCGTLNFPMGTAIFQGYYTASDIGMAMPLSLYQPGGYNCPMILTEISSYTFDPLSDNATISGSCSPNPCFSLQMNSFSTADGYWIFSFHFDFQPGIYTVTGGDEWGQLVILHFKVI